MTNQDPPHRRCDRCTQRDLVCEYTSAAREETPPMNESSPPLETTRAGPAFRTNSVSLSPTMVAPSHSLAAGDFSAAQARAMSSSESIPNDEHPGLTYPSRYIANDSLASGHLHPDWHGTSGPGHLAAHRHNSSSTFDGLQNSNNSISDPQNRLTSYYSAPVNYIPRAQGSASAPHRHPHSPIQPLHNINSTTGLRNLDEFGSGSSTFRSTPPYHAFRHNSMPTNPPLNHIFHPTSSTPSQGGQISPETSRGSFNSSHIINQSTTS